MSAEAFSSLRPSRTSLVSHSSPSRARAAGQRFACQVFDKKNASCYCCHDSEIVKTKFRLVEGEGAYPEDGYEWLNSKTGKWERVPDDTIHWDELYRAVARTGYSPAPQIPRVSVVSPVAFPLASGAA